jgi:hypothetical protein
MFTIGNANSPDTALMHIRGRLSNNSMQRTRYRAADAER